MPRRGKPHVRRVAAQHAREPNEYPQRLSRDRIAGRADGAPVGSQEPVPELRRCTPNNPGRPSGRELGDEKPERSYPKIDPAPNSNIEKDPDDWVSGDELMTGAQASYLKTLSEEWPDAFAPLTKAEASTRIDAFKAKRRPVRHR